MDTLPLPKPHRHHRQRQRQQPDIRIPQRDASIGGVDSLSSPALSNSNSQPSQPSQSQSHSPEHRRQRSTPTEKSPPSLRVRKGKGRVVSDLELLPQPPLLPPASSSTPTSPAATLAKPQPFSPNAKQLHIEPRRSSLNTVKPAFTRYELDLVSFHRF
ncbi:hypothetical protein ABW20_dc0104922 [Dactylellina cionopaga]|nr:hypothetical protein ABW20_dc0104922 [Dactylellina cionopaga]